MSDADSPAKVLPNAFKENLDTMAEFYAREHANISNTQSAIEKISAIFANAIYFAAFIAIVVGWIAVNEFDIFRIPHFDPSPFTLLQGIIALNGVLITIAVLVRQNRLTRLEEKRAHLNLQVTLLAEQKTTKIIQLLEELRGDMPNVRNRVDPAAETLKVETDHHAMLDVLDAQSEHKS